MYCNNIFDTHALVYYFSEALSKKLTSDTIFIPTTESYRVYLILKESFLEFAEKIGQQYFFRLDVRQNDTHWVTLIPQSEKIPGIIYVTAIYLLQKDLLRPDI